MYSEQTVHSQPKLSLLWMQPTSMKPNCFFRSTLIFTGTVQIVQYLLLIATKDRQLTYADGEAVISRLVATAKPIAVLP